MSYGFSHSASWAGISAAIDLTCQLAIVFILLRHRMWSIRRALSIASVVLIVVASAWSPELNKLLPMVVVGIVTSACMYVPQALSIVRSWGTPAFNAYSYLSASLVVVANAFWLVYAFMLHDVYVALPCPFHIMSGIAMIVSRSHFAWRSSHQAQTSV